MFNALFKMGMRSMQERFSRVSSLANDTLRTAAVLALVAASFSPPVSSGDEQLGNRAGRQLPWQ